MSSEVRLRKQLYFRRRSCVSRRRSTRCYCSAPTQRKSDIVRRLQLPQHQTILWEFFYRLYSHCEEGRLGSRWCRLGFKGCRLGFKGCRFGISGCRPGIRVCCFGFRGRRFTMTGMIRILGGVIQIMRGVTYPWRTSDPDYEWSDESRSGGGDPYSGMGDPDFKRGDPKFKFQARRTLLILILNSISVKVILHVI